MQKRARYALDVVLDVVGQCTISDVRSWFMRGVVQCANVRDASCRSYISLNQIGLETILGGEIGRGVCVCLIDCAVI